MTDEWYCEIAGREIGPLTSQQLRAMAAKGQILSRDCVRQGLHGVWTPAAKVKGLLPAAKPLPAKPIVPPPRTDDPPLPQRVVPPPAPPVVILSDAPSAKSEEKGRAEASLLPSARRRRQQERTLIIALLVIIGVLAIAGLIMLLQNRSDSGEGSKENVSRLTERNRMRLEVPSPFGRGLG
jgi:hypothetical protein